MASQPPLAGATSPNSRAAPGLKYPANGKTIYSRPLNRSRAGELSQASFAYLFGEMVSYAQKRVTDIQDLEKRLNEQGHPIGLRLLHLLLARSPSTSTTLSRASTLSSSALSLQPRPLTILQLLTFLQHTLWRHLFGRPADGLEKSNDTPDQYMIIDNEPLVNEYVSVPREMGGFNAAAFVAGIVEGCCDGAGFASKVSAHTVGGGGDGNKEGKGEMWPGRTVFVVKFAPEVIEREGFLAGGK